MNSPLSPALLRRYRILRLLIAGKQNPLLQLFFLCLLLTLLLPGKSVAQGYRRQAANRGHTPRPAVCRIIVPERNGTSYGSGTLVDVRDEVGLVVTNWHVVRDASDRIEVVFPDGFRSFARALKVDADWDLAALVIWRPSIAPIPIANKAPQPNDVLTIAGYGQGTYREATGRCTQYVAPGINFPYEMVEVSVEARQGDSGGPIFNSNNELAGVLFGAGRGTTSGSFAGRVVGFLASVAPDIQQRTESMIANHSAPRIHANPNVGQDPLRQPSSLSAQLIDPTEIAKLTQQQHEPAGQSAQPPEPPLTAVALMRNNNPPSDTEPDALAETSQDSLPVRQGPGFQANANAPRTQSAQQENPAITWNDVAGESLFDQAKTVLALFGLVSLLFVFMKLLGGS